MVSTTSARSSWTRWLLQRWPTTLAVALVAFILSAPEAEKDVAEALPLLPLEYLIVASRRPTSVRRISAPGMLLPASIDRWRRTRW